ncbi:MAG: SDR family NAD(P)-dependent oxidoreductase [Chloroflexi bacterium]|nr:SDR family NAD(P)-dependent oxidoreductase [Chloroflexota bacterium]
MKIFLTGGTGFIGLPLTRNLLARGWQVTVLVRNPNTAQARILTGLGAQCLAGDITERESMRAGMTGADLLIHNAGHYELGLDSAGKKSMQAVNVLGTENVLGLALELGIARTLYISTVQAFGESGPQPRDESYQRNSPCHTTYERTKTEAHAIACEYQRRGLPLIIACPNGAIGPNDYSSWGYYLRMYINQIMPPISPCPDTIFSLVEVNDLARGLFLAAEKGRPGETYLFCGQPKSLREHLACWGKYPGAYKIQIWLPTQLAKYLFWPMEPLLRAFGLPAFMSREMVSTLAINFNYSSQKACQELGWTYLDAEAMWASAMAGEMQNLQDQPQAALISRLKPR